MTPRRRSSTSTRRLRRRRKKSPCISTMNIKGSENATPDDVNKILQPNANENNSLSLARKRRSSSSNKRGNNSSSSIIAIVATGDWIPSSTDFVTFQAGEASFFKVYVSSTLRTRVSYNNSTSFGNDTDELLSGSGVTLIGKESYDNLFNLENAYCSMRSM